MDFSSSNALLLNLLTQCGIEGGDGMAGILLVPPHVRLRLEEFVTVLTAERGHF